MKLAGEILYVTENLIVMGLMIMTIMGALSYWFYNFICML